MTQAIHLGRWDAVDCTVKEVRRIDTPPGNFTHPALAPNGEQVAFWGISDGRGCLWLADVASAKAQCLSQLAGASMHPAWAPDSRKIAYACRPDLREVPEGKSLYDGSRFGRREIHILDLASGDVVQVVADDADNERPAWSPDGTELAFVSTRQGASNLHLVNLASGKCRAITCMENGICYRPVWHPNGGFLVFNNKGPGPHWLWRIDLDGHNLRRLSPGAPTESGHWDHGAFWSADGWRLLFHSNRSGVPGLWVMDASANNLQQVRIAGFERFAAHGTWDDREQWLAFDAKTGLAGRYSPCSSKTRLSRFSLVPRV